MKDDMTDRARFHLAEAAGVLTAMSADLRLIEAIADVARVCSESLTRGGRILFAGNGGSAADAQHFAAELIGRFVLERVPLAAIALTTDSSALTAIGNDYGFDSVFERQVEGLGNAGDVFVGISTSGRSRNVTRALHAARRRGLHTVGLTGQEANDMATLCDHLLQTPSRVTARIQEGHGLIGHILCDLVEREMFGESVRQVDTPT